MIKGQPIEKLLLIKDNTPGIKSILIMCIMCMVLYALFQFVSILWADKKIEKLKHYQYVLKKRKNGKNTKTVATREKPKSPDVYRPTKTIRKEDYEDLDLTDAEKEAMDIFNTLKK